MAVKKPKINNYVPDEFGGYMLKDALYVTPEMFGAAGNGVADDTEALQNAINYAFANDISVYLTNKYLITETIYVKGVRATAAGRGSQVIGNGYARIIAGSELTSIVEFIPATELTTYGITIKDIYLDGNNICTNGIYSSYSTADCIFENIRISECTNALYINNNCYLNNFRAIRAYHCTDYGILFSSGNNTANIFEKCYVDSCANAYKINGQYSTMISCCADAITGIVFDLASFKGSLISCGSEAKNFTTMFKIGSNSAVNVIGGMYYGNASLSQYYIDMASGSRLNIYGAWLNYATSVEETTGALYTIAANAYLFIRESVIYKPFSGDSYRSATAVAYINSAVQTLTETVTVNESGIAEINLNPQNYSITNVYTSRSGWIVIPFCSSSTRYSVKVMGTSEYTPTISNRSFPLTIHYIPHNQI